MTSKEIDAVLSLKKRYGYLPQALIDRSVEKAVDVNELFDILDTCPVDLPVQWDSNSRRWINCKLIPNNTL